jgi:DNA-binding transcriptional MocR family regulator
MISFKIDPGDSTPLVVQVVEGIRRQIDDRLLRPGTKLPSIRKLAESYRISRFTAVESYDRLVALGYLEAAAAPASSRHRRAMSRRAIHRRMIRSATKSWSGSFVDCSKRAKEPSSRAAHGCPTTGWTKWASVRGWQRSPARTERT